MTTNTVVLGAGIVGSAAVWDLVRRGHTVTVADADWDTAAAVAAAHGATPAHLDVDDHSALDALLDGFDAVVSAVPYRFGVAVAGSAIRAGAHYADFGGNPTVVAAQHSLSDDAVAADVLITPDCGLAPGLANVLAGLLIETTPGAARSVQMRVGALPQKPVGALGYQLAFSPAGLINEYAEPCEIIEGGHYTTVEPLTRFETVEWDGWGPLEAFSTAGGTSTMCRDREGTVDALEYKTLRFPGHGRIFAAIREMGLFDESGNHPLGPCCSMRSIRHFREVNPTWCLRGCGSRRMRQGGCSRLRMSTTDDSRPSHEPLLSLRRRSSTSSSAERSPCRGVRSMASIADGALLIDGLEPVGIDVVERSA